MKQKDLALLTVSQELRELAEESGDARILELARMKEARADFSLLARAAKDGIDGSIPNPDALTREMQRRLRENLMLLLRSPMSPMRKGLAMAFTVNYKASAAIVKKLL